ncbi:MAG: soluble NSF attachment family protein [Ignavibacteriaceae bacterium]|jgi:tetratricopeptide (TPR) repeat protein|nr:soluble NSF attachment family protein [Ignavibacteriaceae bacterium]MCW8814082.1 soluble NSF attachment family protein [Chlorobium sp.]MCW8816676.1 soluble NSF attachment family protein [Ignavibacteriaceae bacterium]MCW8824545.1 soluble NSF attachment family protein [Ignavibacteriaceae bacterium]MCW8962022.1 soluble NSF attachment family protein [Ignavibacteriaceae bacterium]
MIKKKKKLSKKEIKQDSLVEFFYNVENYFEKYKNKIFTYAAVVVVAAAAVYFYINQKAANNEKASLELSRVMTLFDQGAYLEAIEGKQGSNIIGLKRIVEEYGGTENGETAKIYLADCYAYLGNYDESIKYYEDYSGSIGYLKATALAGQAGYYASKQNYEEAAKLYLEASKISDTNAENPDYLLNAGINYLKTGDKDEAKILFNKIKEDYVASLAQKEVDKYLAMIQ